MRLNPRQPVKRVVIPCFASYRTGHGMHPFLAQGKASTLRVDVGNMVVHANALPGTPVYSKTFSWNEISDGGEQWIACNNGHSDDRDFDFNAFMSGLAQSPEIYHTNLNGVGVRISLRAISGFGGFPARMTTVPFTARVRTRAGQSDDSFRTGTLRVKVELVKTRPHWLLVIWIILITIFCSLAIPLWQPSKLKEKSKWGPVP